MHIHIMEWPNQPLDLNHIENLKLQVAKQQPRVSLKRSEPKSLPSYV